MESAPLALDLVANCAHDLKTPLAAISSSNQLTISILKDIQAIIGQENPTLTSVINDLEVARHTLQSSLDMAEFMKMSINRCMDLAKVSNHAMKLNPKCETVDIAHALLLPIQCMMTVDPDQVIELKPQPEEACSHVITDLQWLQENVLCLLSNAAKFSSNASISLSVTLCPESSLLSLMEKSKSPVDREVGEKITVTETVPYSHGYTDSATTTADYSAEVVDRLMVLIECEDSGIGLSEEAMTNLFAPFKQAQRLAGGTGLGLFSLANRMEALQGLCGVRGRRDGAQGSLFWFAFPYKPDAEAAELALCEKELSAEDKGSNKAIHPPVPPGAVTPVSTVPVDAAFDDDPLQREQRNVGHNLVISTADSLPCFIEHFNPYPPSPGRKGEIVTPRAARQLGMWPAALMSATPSSSSFRAIHHNSPVMPPFSAKHLDYTGAHFDSRSLQTGAENQGADGGHSGDCAHILLVDDTASIRKITSRTLQREGFRVTTTENGYEALKLLQNQTDRFDAVLMDLQMPVLDGLETVRRFRAAEVVQEGKRRQFIVAVSASADPTMAKSVIEVGFDGYIEKPFNIRVFRAILPCDFSVSK